jgi:hypothetical protein
VDSREIDQLRAAMDEFDFEKASTALDAVVTACAALPRHS